MIRVCRQFQLHDVCFQLLQVDNSDIHAHKNVLACVSPHLMELFSAEEVSAAFYVDSLNAR